MKVSSIEGGFFEVRSLSPVDTSELTPYSTTDWTEDSVLHLVRDGALLQYPAISDTAGIFNYRKCIDSDSLEESSIDSKVELEAVQDLLQGRYPLGINWNRQLSQLAFQLNQATREDLRHLKISSWESKLIQELVEKANQTQKNTPLVMPKSKKRNNFRELLDYVKQLEREELHQTVRSLAQRVVQFCEQDQLFIAIPDDSRVNGGIAPLIGLAINDSDTPNSETVSQIIPVIRSRIGSIAFSQSANGLLYTNGSHFWPDFESRYKESDKSMMNFVSFE